MKGCSTPFVIGELQIKTSMIPVHLLKWLRSKYLTAWNAGKDVELQELSCSASWSANWYSCFSKHLGTFLQSERVLQFDLAVMHLRIYPIEMKTPNRTKTCTWMFIVTLLTTAKRWKLTKNSLVGEQMNKRL